MSFNPYTRLIGLFPKDRLEIGTILSVDVGQARVELLDGTTLIARGSGSIGASVYVRAGVIEGLAPDLPAFNIEI